MTSVYLILVSYEAMDLTYKWKSEVDSDIFIYDKEMAQFDIMSAKRHLKHQVYHSGRLTTIRDCGTTL